MSVTEVLPEEKRNEMKRVVQGQAVVDLLPLLKGRAVFVKDFVIML